MKNRKSRIYRRIIAMSLVLMMAASSMSPIGDIVRLGFSTAIVANAEGENYESFSSNGTGERVSGAGNYAEISGADGVLTRKSKDFTTATILAIPNQIATGSEIKPTVTVKDGDTTLTEGVDYKVTYSDNTEVGTATVKINGIGEYGGIQETEFNIYAAIDSSKVPEATISVYTDKRGTVAQPINGKTPVGLGYYITSTQALDISDDVAATYYAPNNTRNPYSGLYTYLVTDIYNPVIHLIHVHDNYVTNEESILTVECKTEIGAVAVPVAELTVKGSGTYAYGEKIEIVQDTEGGADKPFIANAKKYGGENAKVEFLGNPTIAKSGTDAWSTAVPTSIGQYIAQNGVRFLDTDYYLNKTFNIVAKNVDELTAMVDLDGNDTAYNSTKSTELPTITFDGKTYTPTVSLVYSDFWNGTGIQEVTLTPETDYTVDIQSGTNVGEYTITFTGKGNYTGTKTVKWNIQKASMNPQDVRTASEKSFVYNGANTVDTSLFKVSGVPEGATATYTYFSASGVQQPATPTVAGNYKVKVSYSKANYNDAEITLDFAITKRPVTITPVAGQKITYGQFIPTEVNYTVEQAGENRGLVSGDTIDGNLVAVVGTDILNAGTYNYVLVAENAEYENYTLSLDETNKFTVEKKPLTQEMFTVSPTELTYNGTEQTVTVTASDRKEIPSPVQDEYETPVIKQLIVAADWEIVGNSNKGTDVGTYTVKVKAKENGNYTGELTLDNKKFEIKPLNVSDSEDFVVTLTPSTKVYDSTETTPTVAVAYKGTTLGENDYSVEIQSGTTVGTYTYTVTGKGNFAGTQTGTWTITPADIYSLKITGGSKIYDGKAVTKDNFRVTTKLLSNKSKDTNADLTYTYVFKNAEGTVVDQPKDAGAYTVELTVSDTNGNYNAKTVTAAFEIAKRSVEIYPLENQSAEYGTNNNDIVIAYEYEKMEEDTVTGIIAGEEAVAATFANALSVDFGANNNPANVGFYDIVVDANVNLGNYELVYEYPVQFEITKATLNPDWFTLYIVDEENATNTTQYTEDETGKSNLVFNGKRIIVVPRSDLVEGRDYTVAGETSAYLDGEYTIDIKGKGNYKGTAIKKWKVNPNKDVKAHTVVDATYTYDGNTPEVTVVENDGSAPLPELSQTTYKYWQKADGNWTEIALPPVNAGEYKVQGVVTAKGYEIEVQEAEFKIEQREIAVTIDPKDLTGTYGAASYTVPYTYDADAIITGDKATVTVSGEITVTVGENGVGAYELNYNGVTVNSNNYKLVFPNGLVFTVNKKELSDENIVLDNATVALHDLGTSTTSFKVVVDGKELVKDVDYEVAGTTEADEAGVYTVQVVGKGNYVGFARATWTLEDDPTARAAAENTIRENVTVTIGDTISAKLSGGKKRVTATVNGTTNDGYTITKTGFVYMSASDYVDADGLVIGAENVTNSGRNGATNYTYGMIDNTGAGIYVRGYVVVNNGAYETTVYTDPVKLVYDDLVRYAVTVDGGTFLSKYPEGGFSGTQIQTTKPVIRVMANPAEEGQQFYCWEKNGVIASYNKTFTFYMSEKNIDLKAVYVDAEEEINEYAVAYIETVTPDKANNKLTFVASLNVSEDVTMKAAGLVAADSEEEAQNNNWDYVKSSNKVTDDMKTFRYTWNKTNVTEGTVWYVRAYVTYEYENGDRETVYGDLVKATIDGIIA